MICSLLFGKISTPHSSIPATGQQEPGDIDLADFMDKNFMFNMPLQQFACFTGRSLTTFKTDFKKVFDVSPQRWLTQKRLELAHYQLREKNRRPADIYLEAGFENLLHFSFAFKKHFGYSPTAVTGRNQMHDDRN